MRNWFRQKKTWMNLPFALSIPSGWSAHRDGDLLVVRPGSGSGAVQVRWFPRDASGPIEALESRGLVLTFAAGISQQQLVSWEDVSIVDGDNGDAWANFVSLNESAQTSWCIFGKVWPEAMIVGIYSNADSVDQFRDEAVSALASVALS